MFGDFRVTCCLRVRRASFQQHRKDKWHQTFRESRAAADFLGILLSSSPPNLDTPPRFLAGFLHDHQWACDSVGEEVSGGSSRAGGNFRGAGAAESREKNGNSQGEPRLIEFDHSRVEAKDHMAQSFFSPRRWVHALRSMRSAPRTT